MAIKIGQVYENSLYNLHVKECDTKEVTFDVYVVNGQIQSLFGVQTLPVKKFKESLTALNYTLVKEKK